MHDPPANYVVMPLPGGVPPALPVAQVTRLLRHRLQNFGAAMRMGLGRLSQQPGLRPEAARVCQLMTDEVDGFEDFTDRLSLACGPLPPPAPQRLAAAMDRAVTTVRALAPATTVAGHGEADQVTVAAGNWLECATVELLRCALAAGNSQQPIAVSWRGAPQPVIEVRTPGPPGDAALADPGHEGLGLAIAQRLTQALGATFTAAVDDTGAVCLTLTLPADRNLERTTDA